MSAIVQALAPTPNSLLGLQYQPSSETLWIVLRHVAGRAHNFSLDLLDSLQGCLDDLEANRWQWHGKDAIGDVRCAVMTSEHPVYFSVGGDLAHFRECIERRNADGLRDYTLKCVDAVYRWAMAGAEVATVAVVQGRALGGGFEAVLGANYIIAEEQSEFGFPEILFGLFPMAGGMSLLGRRIGVHQAEKLMREGRLYTANQMLEMGVIDEVCPQGEAATAVRAYLRRQEGSRRARMMLQRAKLRMAPIDYDELQRVVDEWVETALALTPKEVRVLEALIGMQRKEFG
jgi:DSF synthase